MREIYPIYVGVLFLVARSYIEVHIFAYILHAFRGIKYLQTIEKEDIKLINGSLIDIMSYISYITVPHKTYINYSLYVE